MMERPRKIDKSHGFMQSIIKNQVLRDEYDKEQKYLTEGKKLTRPEDQQMKDEHLEIGVKRSSGKTEESKAKSKRVAKQLYVPPHAKRRSASETSSKAPPALQREQTNPRRNSTHNRVESRVLFKFEYENEEGEVQSILVKEDDNAEDLAETFGNQLGLTKAFRKALHIRLKQEMDNFLNS